MNSENENNKEFNKDYYKAMSELSLSQLERRAHQAGCKLEVEFNITQGQGCDNDTFQEGGTFIATFIPIPEEEIEEIENFAGELLASLVKEEIENDGVNWPSENYSVNVHLNGVSEEDFQEYDKIAGDIDLSVVYAYDSLTADIELKEEIVSALEEKYDMETFETICKQDMDALEAIMEEFADNADKTRAINAFDKAKIDPEVF